MKLLLVASTVSAQVSGFVSFLNDKLFFIEIKKDATAARIVSKTPWIGNQDAPNCGCQIIIDPLDQECWLVKACNLRGND